MIHKFRQKDMFFVLDVNSGAVHVVDEIVYDILDHYPQTSVVGTIVSLKDKYSEEDIRSVIEEIDQLISMDQLYSEDTYMDSIEFKTREPIVKAMCLHIAHDCNIRCKYCFASQGDFKGDRSFMSLEVGKKALEFLVKNSGNRRNLEVDFFGGEPLMNFDVVKDLVTYGRELEKEHDKNFRFTMTTNGVLLNDEIIDYLNENMSNVVLSIDGRKEVNDHMRYTISGDGTYDIIVPKFKKLIEKRKEKSYYVRGTFTSNNIDFANDVMHFVDLGFKSTSVEPVVAEPHHDYALKEEDLPVIFDQYDLLAEKLIENHGTEKEFSFFHFTVDLSQGPCVVKRLTGCGAGSEYLAITPQGDVYPCHQFVGNEDFKIGNVLAGVMDFRMNKEFGNAHVYNKEKCRDCWARFYCSGGCHANAYNFNNDIYKPYDVGCEMEKKRIEASIYVYGKINAKKTSEVEVELNVVD